MRDETYAPTNWYAGGPSGPTLYRIHHPDGRITDTEDEAIARELADAGYHVQELSPSGTLTGNADPKYIKQAEQTRAEVAALSPEERMAQIAARAGRPAVVPGLAQTTYTAAGKPPAKPDRG
jgi:hypothetical protein